MTDMTHAIDAATLRGWLNDGQPLALFDVREHGQYGEGHPFFAVPLPYSRLELEVGQLAPRRAERIVLFDDGDVENPVASHAARRLADLGYLNVTVLDGGAPAWAAAGYTLFKGVNVPSKTFGELVEHIQHTPRLSADDLVARRAAGESFVLVDGRSEEEHRKMTVPGALSCPNGDLALRLPALLPNPNTPVVVHCAGRTRSIIGAQTLLNLGLPNPVLALENGTQGWYLAGHALEHGSDRFTVAVPSAPVLAAARERSVRLLQSALACPRCRPRRHSNGCMMRTAPPTSSISVPPTNLPGVRSMARCMRPADSWCRQRSLYRGARQPRHCVRRRRRARAGGCQLVAPAWL